MGGSLLTNLGVAWAGDRLPTCSPEVEQGALLNLGGTPSPDLLHPGVGGAGLADLLAFH